jgi:hypothetical protein
MSEALKVIEMQVSFHSMEIQYNLNREPLYIISLYFFLIQRPSNELMAPAVQIYECCNMGLPSEFTPKESRVQT